MDHTKKFVLVDPRFARPSMLDKTLSGLDNDISIILNGDDSDEIKAKKYISALARFKNYSSPPKSREVNTPPAPVVTIPSVPSVTAASSVTPTSLKSSRKRVKSESLNIAPLLDPSLWRRTQRLQTKKRFGSQWLEYNGHANKKKKKPKSTWIET